MKDNKFILTWKIILNTLPLLGLAGITVPLLLNQPNLSLLGIYLSLPMISAPLVYSYYHQRQNEKVTFHKERILFILLIIYFICLSISILILYSFEVRPYSYHILITIMSSIILFEILFFNFKGWKSTMVLIQIIILFLDVVWGVTLKYYYYIGRTDILAHNWFLSNLVSTGQISNVFGTYRPFPLWHILCSFVYYIIGINIQPYKIMFFLNGIVYSFLIITTYIISLKMFRDTKIALISSLFLCINPAFITNGMYSIPRDITSFLGTVLILLLLGKRRLKSRYSFLAILLYSSIIIYHSVSSAFLLAILLIIYSLQNIYGNIDGKDFITIEYLIFIFVATIGYWMFHAEEIFQSVTRLIYLPGVNRLVSQYQSVSELFNYLQHSILIFFIIVGVLGVLKSKDLPRLTKIFSMVGFMSIVVSFPGPIMLIPKLANTFFSGRFIEVTFLFISLTAAAGFANIYYKSSKYGKLFFIILFISMSFLGISNDFVASDNPLIKREFYTYYLTEEEVTSFNHIAAITKGYLMSDYISYRYLCFSTYSGKAHILEADEENIKFLKNNKNDVILIRNKELSKRPLILYLSEMRKFELRPLLTGNLDYYDSDSFLWETLVCYNRIYSSGCIVGYG